jgi:hypothetical protein
LRAGIGMSIIKDVLKPGAGILGVCRAIMTLPKYTAQLSLNHKPFNLPAI